MRRSGRTPGRSLRLSSCCTRDDNDEPVPATPRLGQITRLTPRTEIGLRGPVSRLPPGMQVGERATRRRSRALTQIGISDATLVAGSQTSEIELINSQRPAEHVAPTERRGAIRIPAVELSITPPSPSERDPGPPSLILSPQNPPTQGTHRESSAPGPEAHRAQDETRQRRRRSLHVEPSPRVYDTRQHRRRSLVVDNLPGHESQLASPGLVPEHQSAPHETRRQRRRSSRIDDSSRRSEFPVTGPEDSSTLDETTQRRRRSLQIDSLPQRPELRQHRRRSYLQTSPCLSQHGEVADLGRLAHPPLGVRHLFPASASPNQPEADEGSAGNDEDGNINVKEGESSKDGAEENGAGGSTQYS